MYRLHPRITSWEYVLQFGDVKLICITLQDRFPTCQAHHSNSANVRMFLETLERMDNDRGILNIHELFRDVLPHTVTRATSNNKCNVLHSWNTRTPLPSSCHQVMGNILFCSLLPFLHHNKDSMG